MTRKFGQLAALTLLLGGCATDAARLSTIPVPIEKIVIDAEAEAKKGQLAPALASLRAAAAAHPGEKLPWLSAAQINFDQGRYGDAIVAALAALERDPHDKLANSLVAVSGLRLSAAALADLVQKETLSSNTRSEAQELVRTMKSSLVEESAVAQQGPRPGPRSGRAQERRSPAPPPKSNGGSADPFAALK